MLGKLSQETQAWFSELPDPMQKKKHVAILLYLPKESYFFAMKSLIGTKNNIFAGLLLGLFEKK